MEEKKLTSVIQLYKSAFRLYIKEENLIYLTKIVLLSLVILIPIVVVSMIIGFAFGLSGVLGSAIIGNSMPDVSPFVILMFIVMFIFIALGSVWIQATEIKAVENVFGSKIIGVKETLKLGWGKARSVFVSSLLGGICIVLGFLFFIVPGVILAIWWSFASYAVVTENLGGIAGLKRSRELVKGYFGPVFVRLLILVILASALQYLLGYLDWVGSLILFLLSPLYIIVPYAIYEDLKRVKGTSAPAQ